MNEAARQYHYSVRHWNKQFRDTDLYIDRINAETNKLEGRMPWNRWHDKDTGLTPGITPSTAETITRLDRLKHLRASASDRLRYAHVMRFKMCNDKLLINGIAFDTMLEDERKALHERIDKSRKHIEAHIEARKFKERLQGMGLAQRCMTILDHIHKQTAPPYQLGGLDNTSVSGMSFVDAKGREHIIGPGEMLPPKIHADGTRYHVFSKGSIRFYGPDFIKISKRVADLYELMFVCENDRYKFFCCNIEQWHERSTKPLPEINESVTIKGVTWIRIK